MGGRAKVKGAGQWATGGAEGTARGPVREP